MADGWGSAAANSALDTVGSTYSWLKLHTGAPGSAGTSNAATETTRKQITYASASGGSKASSADATWTNVAGSETYSHFSLWTASSAGTFGVSGAITANAVTAGDTFTISSGSLTLSVTLAS
jgi:UDP-N-acetylglucosamine enolpyruvyl transferase